LEHDTKSSFFFQSKVINYINEREQLITRIPKFRAEKFKLESNSEKKRSYINEMKLLLFIDI